MATANIISYLRTNCQCDPITLYDIGLNFKPTKIINIGQPKHLQGITRGEIKQFSTASARRLREKLLLYRGDGDALGVTLTLPLNGGPIGKTTDYWRDFWNLFQVKFRQQLPNDVLIWRIELQKRGAPHIHGIIYTKDPENTKGTLSTIWLEDTFNLAKRIGAEFNGAFGIKYAIRFDRLVGVENIGYYRYLVDHATKHKREQLGYKGRQWGVINAKGLSRKSPLGTLSFINDRHRALFVRAFQRFNRYPVTINGKIVKYRRSRRTVGLSAVRGGAETIRRLWLNARDNSL